MSLGRRFGRLARGFVSRNIGEERFKETVRFGRERGETLKDAFGAAWRGASEEWRAAEQRRAAEQESTAEQESADERTSPGEHSSTRASWRPSGSWRDVAPGYIPRKYPPEVLLAYHKLGLSPGDGLDAANKKRRDLVKRHHPDRFAEPDKRARAERLTAEINAAHDVVERYLLGS
ncbi:MAG: DnaJ-class molecular chaperone [uncultured Rubrobacteraceae bacterium]|uniref:DnaJ-class molecular chaperone n=1 Tax=uncultured Rubrobacteraceae bacterium TaxID=349277 RepID=A0A6J4RIH3_9ACTN|nr:MAG: DnaJ-class molecular chaperone [uncultured Rubrobacteraceae bacterium]